MSDPRALAKSVLEPGWTTAKGLVGVEAHELVVAIEAYEGVISLMHAEPKMDGPGTKAILDALRPIGAKVCPTMSADEATTWRKAMALALSDLPGSVALKAVRRAIHQPLRFISDAETVIREIAREIEARNNLALRRLRMMRAEIERAANPTQKQIADRANDPITVGEVAGWTEHYRRMGVECGFITKEMAEAAEALVEERKQALDKQAEQA